MLDLLIGSPVQSDASSPFIREARNVYTHRFVQLPQGFGSRRGLAISIFFRVGARSATAMDGRHYLFKSRRAAFPPGASSSFKRL